MKSDMKFFLGLLVFVLITYAMAAYIIICAPVSAEGGVKKSKRCGMCHRADSKVTISVEIEKQDTERVYYKVSGSTNDKEQGWGVFLGKKPIAKGSDIGTFDLPKDGKTYKIYWIDDKSACEILKPE